MRVPSGRRGLALDVVRGPRAPGADRHRLGALDVEDDRRAHLALGLLQRRTRRHAAASGARRFAGPCSELDPALGCVLRSVGSVNAAPSHQRIRSGIARGDYSDADGS